MSSAAATDLREDLCRSQRADHTCGLERLHWIAGAQDAVRSNRLVVVAGVASHSHQLGAPDESRCRMSGRGHGAEGLIRQATSVVETRLGLGKHRLAPQQLPPCQRPADLLGQRGHGFHLPSRAAEVAPFECHVDPPQMRPHLFVRISRLAAQAQHALGQRRSLVQSIRP